MPNRNISSQNDDIVIVDQADSGGTKTPPKQEDYYKKSSEDFSPDQSHGADSAVGTDYSWDEEGREGAKTRYQMDEQSAIQDSLGSRQELNAAGQQAQAQHALQQYSDRQSAQRAGWTGGYVLDQNRQREYMKASIQANMYGAMELQKMGFESQLAAARLAYDINKEELALERYRLAQEYSFAYANATGILITPEIRDMNEQYRAAEMVLSEMDLEDDNVLDSSEYQRAKRIIESIERWYGELGVSPQGVKTMAYQDFIFQKHQAAIQAAYSSKADHQLVMTNPDGSYVVNAQGNASILDLYLDDPSDILEYLESSTHGQRAFNQYLNLNVQNEMVRLINQYPDMTEEELIQKFAENNKIIDLLTRLGEDVINYISPERISTDDEDNRVLNLNYSHGDGRYFNIRIGLDGQEISTDGADTPITIPDLDDDEKLKDDLNNDPISVVTDLPDLLGFGIQTQNDLVDIYGTSFGNVTKMATDYYARMQTIEVLFSGNYTAEQADEAVRNAMWLFDRQGRNMDLKNTPYDDNKYPVNAYTTHQMFNFMAKRAGLDPEVFSWNWNIQKGDSVRPGIEANSLTGSQAAFLESLGFVNVERGRTLWLPGTGTNYYAMGVPATGGISGLAGVHNFRGAFIRYLQQNATPVDKINTTEGE